jgi:hypothetical protein
MGCILSLWFVMTLILFPNEIGGSAPSLKNISLYNNKKVRQSICTANQLKITYSYPFLVAPPLLLLVFSPKLLLVVGLFGSPIPCREYGIFPVSMARVGRFQVTHFFLHVWKIASRGYRPTLEPCFRGDIGPASRHQAALPTMTLSLFTTLPSTPPSPLSSSSAQI